MIAELTSDQMQKIVLLKVDDIDCQSRPKNMICPQ